MGTIRAYYPAKSPKGRETGCTGRIPSGCWVQKASAQSGPALDASRGTAPELPLANWDCKCCLFPAKRHSVVWDDGGKMVKSGDRRESTLKFFLLHFPPLRGWVSDKNADLLLGLGEGEAIAVSAHLTLRQRAGVTREAEPARAPRSHGIGERPGLYLPFASGLRQRPALLLPPALPADPHQQPFCNTLHRGRPLTLPYAWKHHRGDAFSSWWLVRACGCRSRALRWWVSLRGAGVL